MYALICLEEDAAFQRYGYLSTDRAAAVRKEVTKQCSEVRPHALALVRSFGIPGAFLSPIAFNWIDANALVFSSALVRVQQCSLMHV
jgi:acyl-CoA oxidase